MTTWRFGIFFWSCYVLCRVINDFLFSYFSSALSFSWGFSVITFDWMSEEISAFYWDNWNFDGKSFLVTKKFGFAIKVSYYKIKIEAKNQLWKEIEILVKNLFQSMKTFTTVRFLVRIRTRTPLWNLFNPKGFGYHLKRLQINLIKFKSAFQVKNYAKFLLKIEFLVEFQILLLLRLT